jgi:mono/diheme cytochrome c family protein
LKKVLLGLLVVLVGGGGFVVLSIVRHGVSAKDEPTAFEKVAARAIRHVSIPREAKEQKNPVALRPEVLAEARAHFADHCASCHGNDGKGNTEMGRNLYPKAPDMTREETQKLSDGELFYIIENGIRLTGMPAWGQGTKESTLATWKLVHFIRHLPAVTTEEQAEMKGMNPKSPKDLEEEEAEKNFLQGEPRTPVH